MKRKRVRLFLIFFLFSICITSCLQVYNSSTSDEARFGGGTVGDGTPAGDRFAAAYTIIKDECFGCHPATLAKYNTQQAWIDNGYVVAGDPLGSTVYQSIRGSDATSCNDSRGCQNMPQDDALSADAILTIKDWIQQM
jgi:hypothetical protein